MSTPDTIAAWMLSRIEAEGCLYQDDVVDHALRLSGEQWLRENADGNLVVGKEILAAFLAISKETVVWVKPDRYWRWRVAEDEPGREARG
jgi:hypothetical protein